ALRALHRRVLLDQARNDLLFESRLDRRDFEGRSEDLLIAIRGALPSNVQLSEAALRTVLLGGPIRAHGNVVAHDASPDDISLAILGTDITEKQRKTLWEIYVYVYRQEPDLNSIK
ncbi:hypothetical protein C0991_000554, partial [Blastosporella zonata]